VGLQPQNKIAKVVTFGINLPQGKAP